MLEIIQLPVLSDNYIYLLHDPDGNETAVVDPALALPVMEVLDKNGWQLNYILNTHHHWDHVGGNEELKQQTGCKIIASEYDRQRIPGVDKTVNHGDKIKLGHVTLEIMATPGHTLGHIVFYCPNTSGGNKYPLLFCGDTLFSMGCGRLFEGTAKQMWQSLQLIKKLPKSTYLYCTHEYTMANGQFAMTLEAENPQLQHRLTDVIQLRKKNRPTIPSVLSVELETNPFLREQSLSIRQSINMFNNPPLEVFTKIRQLKDNFVTSQ